MPPVSIWPNDFTVTILYVSLFLTQKILKPSPKDFPSSVLPSFLTQKVNISRNTRSLTQIISLHSAEIFTYYLDFKIKLKLIGLQCKTLFDNTPNHLFSLTACWPLHTHTHTVIHTHTQTQRESHTHTSAHSHTQKHTNRNIHGSSFYPCISWNFL